MKICCRCKKEIEIENKKYCKECKREVDALYYQKNREKVLSRNKSYRIKNRKKVLQKMREYNVKNKENKKITDRKYYIKNKETRIKYSKLYYEKNKEKILFKNKLYKKEYVKTNLNYKIACLLRKRLCDAVTKKHKNEKTLELLGCSIEQLKIYLESKFTEGMSWNNHGVYGWHIDHIKPCAKFDLTDLEQQKECFHYSNLQPLWAEENLKKGAK